jgi:hypothetical protein
MKTMRRRSKLDELEELDEAALFTRSLLERVSLPTE